MILSENWFMEGYIDFELQKYRLLAYLKEVKDSFHETRLYPYLADTVFHYNNLVAFRDNKKILQDSFPKRLDHIDVKRLEMVYERILADDELMQELEQIIGFSLGEMKRAIGDGAEIYDLVEKQLAIEPVGIVPLYRNEGYVLLRYGAHSEVRVYNYTITLFEHKDARYKGIRMEYMDTRTKTLSNTYQQIKLDIIREYHMLPNPAVYTVEYPLAVPLNETLLPIAKRVLVRHIEHGV